MVVHQNLFNGYNDLTSSIITDPNYTTNWTVTDNFMMAGAYTIYCPHGTTSGFVVQNNRFYPKAEDATDRRSPAYGLTERCDTPGVTFTGNRTDDTGATINADGSLS
ncbi:hypothetical protein [Dactylosporangium sp. CA-139066]|uniref:hypothetical protein n=1 Tax=Dactylosporangium sp. CA-139066 TaxID=3239930 RepID=UPI003D8E0956